MNRSELVAALDSLAEHAHTFAARARSGLVLRNDAAGETELEAHLKTAEGFAEIHQRYIDGIKHHLLPLEERP